MIDFRKGDLAGNEVLVTIGVLSYNYATYLELALDSLLNQTYPYIELIIIDDGSTDGCPQIIEKWITQNNIHCIYIKHEANLGITRTSNEIVKLSKGKYLTLFATDDVMLPERIEKQVLLLEEAGESFGMCYADCEFIDEDGNSLGRRNDGGIIYEGDVLEAYVTRDFGFTTPTSLIRRTVFDRIGFYDERVLIEDYNLFLRLVACFKVKYCTYPCILYRIKKKPSRIFEKWEEHNRERYYHDRILSNSRALKFINSKNASRYLKKKIVQYLKSLAINDSKYFYPLFIMQLANGNFMLPYKAVYVKLNLQFRSLFQKRSR